jgi:multidrug efflux pump subunit AcrB
VVRVNGKRQVYVPVFRQLGASTLEVVDSLKKSLPNMKSRLSRDGIELKPVMDQSVYVRQSIESLVEEGVMGAVLCALVILIFLGEWRMTVIAVLTIPIAVLAALAGLFATGNTLNVMTLAGLSLAIGPLVDSAIICLENTHRNLALEASPEEAAFLGASEVAMPELVASLCTLLVLAPLALMPGLGEFLYRPMAIAVALAMGAAYFLSRSFVPSRSARWLIAHGSHQQSGADSAPLGGARGLLRRAFVRWEALIEIGIRLYVRLLDRIMSRRLVVVLGAVAAFVLVMGLLGGRLRREFFPEVDAGAFEIYVRAASGTRIEETERRIARVEAFVRKAIGRDLQIIISELGVVADLSAAYTPNAGPMDAVVKIQLLHDRGRSAQDYVRMLRRGFSEAREFADLEFAFDAGGMIRSAMNEGKSSPINIRISGKNSAQSRRIAEAIQAKVRQIAGIVDVRIIQRLDYPQFTIDVDRAKSAELGLNQAEVMKNVVAALNSSIQYHKKNFWIDPVSKNQYFVGVQYFEEDIDSMDDLLDVPITGPGQRQPVPLRNIARLRPGFVPTEITHTNLQSTMDLVMGVDGRDLGHAADDVAQAISQFGQLQADGAWIPFEPSAASANRQTIKGAMIELSGEYSRMRETFRTLGFGLALATLLIYALMAALFKSYSTPLVILFAVPLGLVGVVSMLYLTGTAINVQSLLGVIFMVGIIVSNTVLLVDFAQNLRLREGLGPDAAIRKAASIRVRPVVMTALAAFFALLPMALALGRGSEANGPLGRAVLGGIIAGLVTTLLVVPSLYSLVEEPRLSR